MKNEIKKNLLKMLSKDMSGMMSEGRELPKKGMAVKVMAKDEAGLKKGLSKAEELLKLKFGSEESEDESEEMDDESCEMPEMMDKMSESEDESEESEEMEESDDIDDLEEQLAKIQAKIAAKKA